MRVPVKSSNIDAVDYNPATKELAVEFNTGKIYHLGNIPSEIYQALLEAPSVGSFYQNVIRPSCQVLSVEDKKEKDPPA